MPKVYGFDTGFVCAARGWQQLRTDDLGQLWEHFVLNELTARLQHREIFYWRDKRGHELDFVLPGKRQEPLAIECKWSADDFDASNLKSFRAIYPRGENVVVAQDVSRAYTRDYKGMQVRFEGLAELAGRLAPETFA